MLELRMRLRLTNLPPSMHSCTCTAEDCRTCEDQVVCRCLQVTAEQVVVAITTLELRTMRDVRQTTGAGDGCTACHRKIKALLMEHSASRANVLCVAG